VHSLKCLGMIFDNKLTFRENTNFMVENAYNWYLHFKIGKAQLGLNHVALKTIYTGKILPLLLYRTPVWKKVIHKISYKLKLVRVQRIINIKIAKAYYTVSNEALCILTGLTHIAMKIEEVCQFYQLTNTWLKSGTLFDRDMEVSYWHHQQKR